MLEIQDLASLGLIIFLEGVFSIDNALALAVLARRLPPHQQKKALTYGLIGAFVFQFIALSLAAYLMQWRWIKFIGGGYLIFVAAKHWLSGGEAEKEHAFGMKHASFWKTVILIEVMDLAFAVDNILAAVAITPKFWIVYTGVIIGLVAMRFVAGLFIQLLKKHPYFEASAYILISIIGAKIILDGVEFSQIDFHSSGNPAFWIFWGSIVLAVAYGFRPGKPADLGLDLDKLKD